MNNQRGSKGKGHKYSDTCVCHRCRHYRKHLFSKDLTKAVRMLERKGGRTITGSYTDERGTRGKTMPAAFVPTFEPETIGAKDKSITATQELASKPLFTPADLPVTLVGVTTVKDGKEVNIVHKTQVRTKVRPVKSLLGPKPNFNSYDNIKRRTSRSGEVNRENEETIGEDVVRLSWNRPDHLVRQAEQEAQLLDIELGIDTPAPPDDADLS